MKRQAFAVWVCMVMIASGFVMVDWTGDGAEGYEGVGNGRMYAVHSPIFISGDMDFYNQAMAEGWPGNGTSANPYIIEGYDIDGTGEWFCIYISGTTVHFIIRDCYLHSIDVGLILEVVQNGNVRNNTISNNAYGIYLWDSSGNTIDRNTVSSNTDYGIVIEMASDNIIYHNNFINNTYQAYDDGTNQWDDGYPSGGNYWSDYDGTDGNSDGIGDWPYYFDGGQDDYPLMAPWDEEPATGSHSPIRINSNADFTPANGVSGGDGSQANPWIIEGWDIDGTGYGYCIYIGNTTDYFVVRDCYLHDASGFVFPPFFNDSGLILHNVSNAYIHENFAARCGYHGIYLDHSTSNDIHSNNVSNNSWYGIMVDYLGGNEVYNNTVYSNNLGISISTSDSNDIHDNTLFNNNNGIDLYESNYNILRNNNAFNNSHGFYVHYSEWNSLSNNTGNFNTNVGIYLVESDNNHLIGNVAMNNWIGCYILFSNDNMILENIFSSNNDDGLTIDASYDNNIENNWMTSNANRGIYLWGGSYNNSIISNNISSNGYGMYLTTSGNRVYHNSLITNAVQAYDALSNQWDDGYPSGGNYWSDYNGTDWDGDGIGDWPYFFTGGQDNYPLMEPWNPASSGPVQNIDTGERFDTIQAAIDDQDTYDDHTITVAAGTYYECLNVYKALTIIGEDRELTTIDGNGMGNVVTLWAASAIRGFTIRNSGDFQAGIWLSDGCRVEDNVITDNYYGIQSPSSNNLIFNNQISNNFYGISIEGPEKGFYFLAYNMRLTSFGYLNNDPLQGDYGLDFRQAVAHCIDKEYIVNTLLNGCGVVGHGPVSPVYGEWFNGSLLQYEFNLSLANGILDAAGWLDYDSDGWRERPDWLEIGSSFSGVIEILTPDMAWDPVRVHAGEMIAENLRLIGINAIAVPLEFNTLVNRFNSHNFDMLILGWKLGSLPTDFLYELFHSNGTTNDPGYRGTVFDMLIDNARAANDTAVAQQYVRDCQFHLANDLPYDVLYFRSTTGNKVIENSVSFNQNGIRLISSAGNMICRNNIINNAVQAYDETGANQWDDGYPGIISVYGENVTLIKSEVYDYQPDQEAPQDFIQSGTLEEWLTVLANANYSYLVDAESLQTLDVSIAGHGDSPDLDLAIFMDGLNGQPFDGIAQWEEIITQADMQFDCYLCSWGTSSWCYCADADSLEGIRIFNPPDGRYIIKVLGFTVIDGLGHFDLSVVTGFIQSASLDNENIVPGSLSLEMSELQSLSAYRIDYLDQNPVYVMDGFEFAPWGFYLPDSPIYGSLCLSFYDDMGTPEYQSDDWWGSFDSVDFVEGTDYFIDYGTGEVTILACDGWSGGFIFANYSYVGSIPVPPGNYVLDCDSGEILFDTRLSPSVISLTADYDYTNIGYGNYWSDYNGTDFLSGPGQDEPGSDGVGDWPYYFAWNHDNYPMMVPLTFAPKIWVDPAQLNATAITGQATQVPLTIGNSGTGDLTYSVMYGSLTSRGSTDPLPPDPTGFSALHDLTSNFWIDGGNDAFDGYACVDVTVGGVQQTGLDITTGSREYTTNGYTYRIISDWAENHILRYRIEPVTPGARDDITVRLYGNLGSDSGTQAWPQTFNHCGFDIDYLVTNDDGLDGLFGDPQVTHFMIPSDPNDLASVNYSIFWDNPDIRAVDVSLPMTIYVTASYHPHADIVGWVKNDMMTVSANVSATPQNGTITMGSQANLNITFDATGLNPGVYTGTIYITHNAPNQSAVAVPFIFTVLADEHDIRVIDMVSQEIGFTNSSVFVGASVINQGLSNETDIEVRLLANGLIVDSYIIPLLILGEYFNLTLNWTPLANGPYLLEVFAVPVASETSVWNNMMSKQINIFDIMATPWFDGFEGGWGQWTSEIITPSSMLPTEWEIGDPMGAGPGSAYSGTQCAGTNIDDFYYPDNGDITLMTPWVELGTGPQILNFQTWYNMWYGWCNGGPDGGFVEINDGTGWTQINPVIGYPDWGRFGGYNTGGFSGDSDDWEFYEFDLSAYAGQVVQVRFHFATESCRWLWGWYLDDVYMGSPPLYRCELDPELQYDYGIPGGGANYLLTVKNTGANNDTYDLGYANNNLPWPVTFYDTMWNPITSIFTFAGNSSNFIVQVNIPGGSMPGDYDLTDIYVTSQSDGSVWDFAQVQTQVPYVTDWFDDFESGQGLWTTEVFQQGNPQTHWEIGDPMGTGPGSAYSGTQCAGTNIDDWYYPFDADMTLNSPFVQLGSGVQILNFQTWYDMWYSPWCGPRDGGFVEINDGMGWTQIYPNGGYPATNGDFGGYNTDGFSGTSSGWEYYEFDLSAYADQVVQIRFHFGTTSCRWMWGWYLDDVFIGSPPSYRCELNPEFQDGLSFPGGSAVYLLTLSNIGLNNDTYDLLYWNNNQPWSVTFYDTLWIPIISLSVPAWTDRNFIVEVNIPWSAMPGEYDITDIYAVSQGDPAAWSTAQVQTTVPYSVNWYDGFEDGWGMWTTEVIQQSAWGPTNWEIGDPQGTGPGTAHWGNQCAGTNINDVYYTFGADITMVSPYVQLGPGAQILSFYTWYNIRYGCIARDGGFVEINNGGGWTQIWPNGGYPANGSMGGYWTDGFSGDSNGWQYYEFDLSAYAGQIVQVRFHFAESQFCNNYWGWYVDDVYMGGPHNFVSGCSLDPEFQSGTGFPGSTSDYIITLTNTGNGTDTYDLAYWNNNQPWPVEFYQLNAAPVFVNPSFETGDFTGWIAQDMAIPFNPLQVGANWPPTDGSFAAYNGFDGGGPDTILLAQDVYLPANANQLAFDYRAWWNNGGTQDRVFTVEIEPFGGGAPMQSEAILVAQAGTFNGDTGDLQGSVDVSSFAGMWVRISFEWFIPEVFTGPAGFQLDNIRVYETLGAPITSIGPLAPGSSAEFIARVNIPAGALPGDFDVANITSISRNDPMVRGNAQIRTEIPPYSVELAPESQSTYGTIGSDVVYTLTLTNTGPEDIYDLWSANNTWPVEFFDLGWSPIWTLGPVPGGDSLDFYAVVHIPAGAMPGEFDIADIYALSWNDWTVWDMAQVRTQVLFASPWYDGFEDGWGVWTTEVIQQSVWGPTNWEIGDPSGAGPGTALNGTNCAGTNIDDVYYTYGADITMVSPYVQLGPGTQILSFYTWYNIRYGCNARDGGFVEINNGGGWTQIWPNGGYPASGSMGGYWTDGFSGDSNGWQYYEFDLSAYAGQIVQVRFHFAESQYCNNYWGWYVDDVSITSDIEPPVHSNEYPADGSRINDPSPTISVEVTDNIQVDLSTVKLYLNGFNVFSDKTPIPGGYRVSYDHEGMFSDGQVVTCRIVARDINGNLLDWTWTFTVDLSNPFVVSVSPPDGSEGVSLTSTIEVEFSEPMDQLSAQSAFSIFPPTSGSFAWNGTTMIFIPDSPLLFNTVYFVSVGSWAMDLAGNGMDDYYWSFNTGDSMPPEHFNESPPIDGFTTTLDPVISVHVTDLIGVDPGTIRLYVQGFRVDCAMAPIPGGYNVSYWHESGFSPGDTVTCRIVARDIYGNLLDFTWEFTITNISPELEITKTAPATSYQGDLITYTISIQNLGTDTAYDVWISEIYPFGTSFISAIPIPVVGNNIWYIGNIPPGGSVTITILMAVNLMNGNLANAACVDYSDALGNPHPTEWAWANTTVIVTYFEIPLHAGWNLVSIPLVQTNTSILSVLSSIAGQWSVVKYYDTTDAADHWKTYRPGSSANDLWNIDHTMGFWIFANVNTILTVYGEIPTDTQIILRAGWNLVGYPTLNTTTTLANALFGTGYLSAEGYCPVSPYIMALDNSYIMQPGEGYWVYVPADAVWNIANYVPPQDSIDSLADSDVTKGHGITHPAEAGQYTVPCEADDIIVEPITINMPDYTRASSGWSSVLAMVMLLALVCVVAGRRRKD